MSPDIRRTVAELQSKFADNLTGEISAQDLRDFLLSEKLQFCAYFYGSPATTTIGTAGVYVKAAGATTLIAQDGFTMSANRATYNGTQDVGVTVVVFASISVGAKDEVGIQVGINGVVLDHSKMTHNVGAIGDKVAIATPGFSSSIEENDFIELFVGNEDTTNDVTVEKGVVIVLSKLE